jgi:MFS family permease
MKKLYRSLAELGRPFFFVWLGQSISLFGAVLMQFALSVWVFQQTGSVLDFSGVLLAAALPMVLVMPLAGSVVDRFDRRYVMVVAEIVAALITLTLALALWHGTVQVVYLYVFNAAVSLVAAFRLPAYQASVSFLVPKEKFTHATGVMGVSTNVLTMLSPVVAAAVMGFSGLFGVVLLAIGAFSLSSMLLLRSFHHMAPVAMDESKTDQSLVGAAATSFSSALAFFRLQPLVFGLLFYVVIQGALLALASTMLTPLVLSHHTPEELSLIMVFGGFGGLAGAALLVVVDKLERLMIGILLCDATMGLCVLLAGLTTSLALLCAVAFVALFAAGFGEGCSHALWLRKAPQGLQGSIFAMVGTLVAGAATVVVLSGGILVDTLFEPALAPGGQWELSVGSWFAEGKGRGLALLFVICGGSGLFASIISFAHMQLRRFDLVVPDAGEPAPAGLAPDVCEPANLVTDALAPSEV